MPLSAAATGTSIANLNSFVIKAFEVSYDRVQSSFLIGLAYVLFPTVSRWWRKWIRVTSRVIINIKRCLFGKNEGWFCSSFNWFVVGTFPFHSKESMNITLIVKTSWTHFEWRWQWMWCFTFIQKRNPFLCSLWNVFILLLMIEQNWLQFKWKEEY